MKKIQDRKKRNVVAKNKECNDKKCPFHSNISLRGRNYKGTVVSKDTHRTAVVEWHRIVRVRKYERFEKKRTRVKVHNPSCINAELGDKVTIAECRPLSKTKKFVIIEKEK